MLLHLLDTVLNISLISVFFSFEFFLNFFLKFENQLPSHSAKCLDEPILSMYDYYKYICIIYVCIIHTFRDISVHMYYIKSHSRVHFALFCVDMGVIYRFFALCVQVKVKWFI